MKLLSYLCTLIVLSSAAASLPNIVILLADDLGIGDVGCFGNDTIKTPNIDSIAAQGVKLNHHLTAAAVCTPSRAALLTGRYPVRSGMESTGRNKVFFFIAASGGLPQTEITVAKALKEKGYATALIGKWHLGNDKETKGDLVHHPLKHGFDKFFGLPLSNFKDLGDDNQSVITAYVPNIYSFVIAIVLVGLTATVYFYRNSKLLSIGIIVSLVIFPIIISVFLLNLKTINGILMKDSEVIEQPVVLEGLTQRLVHEARTFIHEKVANKTPFLLFLSFVHVHTALFCDPRFRGVSAHGQYGDNVEELDWAVGEVLAVLKWLNVFDDTFVYFSSDNGAHIEERGPNGEREGGYNGIYRGGKTMAGFEGGIRVPSIVSWPKQITPGKEVKIPTSQMDIFPTLLNIADVNLPTDRIIDGKSLLPILKNKVADGHHNILFHYCGQNIHAATFVQNNGDLIWKIHWITPRLRPGSNECEYVCHCFGSFVVHHNPPLLYDLKRDPSEKHALDVKSYSEYQYIIDIVENLRSEHEKTVEKVPNQFSFSNSVWKPWLQPCCNFPMCHCTEDKPKVFLN